MPPRSNELAQASAAEPPAPPPGVAADVGGDPADAAIERAIAQRDRRAALAEIDRVYGDRLYRFIRGMMSDDHRADDVFQTALVQIYSDLERYRANTALRAWLFTIARNRCLDALKAQRRWARRTATLDDLPEPADDRASAQRHLDDAQLALRLERCVGELAPHVRSAVLLRYQQGLPYDRIAALSDEKPATIRARVSRALPCLRRCIEREEIQ